MDPAHRQSSHQVRLEWGPTGADAIAEGADIAVVVDVLSFTTTLCVALEQGIRVLPFAWRDERAAAYADAHDAVLAVGRHEARRDGARGVSLSPETLLGARGIERLVLPSPNGSALCARLADRGVQVVGACLRNRSAVAAWLAPQLAEGAVVAVLPAGERWPDGTLRPAIEDLWGAGAVLDALPTGRRSAEAAAASRAFVAVGDDLAAQLLDCASGRELVEASYAADVRIAAELDVADVVPLLGADGFAPAPERS
ncbi:MAG: 2-phosphosulfolactate phosphatase [Actinobacteria bacterium]|uniref:2-phosphosulfolactate phosphatase n=1 Tax=freshwater metagenome TaxID=449393 RepID=A0A6J6NWT1_9ZZZZ|nr:2-phosphosulfolactate phosphatase [Actinomycetota bacterium]